MTRQPVKVFQALNVREFDIFDKFKEIERTYQSNYA